MALETAYHKLGKTADFESIKKDGFRFSTPAEDHWLGEGVYFFLDPNGHQWACKWPCNANKPRSNQTDGIVKTTIDTDLALDLRDLSIMRSTQKLVNMVRLALKFNDKYKDVPDGLAFAKLFMKGGLFFKAFNFDPKVVIANFDSGLKPYRVEGGRVFLTEEINKITIGPTTQIQACVRDCAIIGPLELNGS